jgi:fibronectin type 3 domain-containing protein
VYYTAMAKGINPDNQIFDALNYDHELDLWWQPIYALC